jgi:hypothetical protein
MAKRKQPRQPPPPDGIPEGFMDLVPMIEEAWTLFREFQRETALSATSLSPAAAKLGRLIEQDEEACLSIFGSGFSSGLQMMLRAIQDAHLRVHLAEMLDDLPAAKRPRA